LDGAVVGDAMTSWAWIVSVTIALTALGFARVRSENRSRRTVRDRISSLLEALRTYMTSDGRDATAYTELLSLSALLQEDLGPDAVTQFKPAFSNVFVDRYAALVNHVPALHYELNIATVKDSRTVAVYCTSLQEILLRAAAKLDLRLKAGSGRLRNPIVLILYGIRTILALPLWLLVWSGTIPTRKAESLASGFVVRLLTAMVFVVGLVGSLITITLGWSSFMAVLRGGAAR
jgi:hypothetical protein